MSKAVKKYKINLLILSVVSCVAWYLLFKLLVNSDSMSKYHFITYKDYSRLFPTEYEFFGHLKYIYLGIKQYVITFSPHILVATYVILVVAGIFAICIYENLQEHFKQVSYQRSENHSRIIKKAVEVGNFLKAEKLLEQYKNSSYGREKTYQSLNVIIYCCKFNKK